MLKDWKDLTNYCINSFRKINIVLLLLTITPNKQKSPISGAVTYLASLLIKVKILETSWQIQSLPLFSLQHLEHYQSK